MDFHDPVLVVEVMSRLPVTTGKVFCDGTLGSAGHGIHMVRALRRGGIFVGLDRDPAMITKAKERLEALPESQDVKLILEPRKYEELPDVLAESGIAGADGILLDLGLNSLQLEVAERGFSFMKDGPLDGRFNPEEPGTRSMADLVNTMSEGDLRRILRDYADERHAGSIARRVVSERRSVPFTTTRQLAELVTDCYPPKSRHDRIHPATRTFQALRIAANDELGSVERGIRACISALNPGGVLCVISYHSGEDRITKRLFDDAGSPRPDPSNRYSATTFEGVDYRVESRGAELPTEEETARNARARSARLRTLRRVGGAA